MKLLKPLRTLTGFLRAFDNGGHFWSLWSHADDGVVTVGELAKAGPSLIASRAAMLHFELLRGFLGEADAAVALASLDRAALERWKKYKPTRCSAAEALNKRCGTTVIVEAEAMGAYERESAGITRTHMIMVGKILVPVMVPIASHFRLWRLDEGNETRRSAMPLLASEPKKLDLSGSRLAIGALVCESSSPPGGGGPKRRYLMGVAACRM